jgi:periplasmic nitrate reductase NapD
MSILGVIVRTRPGDLAAVRQELSTRPGVDIAADPGDGRVVIVIEDTATTVAAALLGEIATWKTVLNTSLVYEYSGPDSPPPDGVEGFIDWRRNLAPDVPLEPTT